MKPYIALTSSLKYGDRHISTDSDYYDAIYYAGGLPIVLPVINDKEFIDKIITKFDGLFLTGGCDVNPALYGENPLPQLAMVSPERDEMEISLIHGFVSKHKPIFAICRGIQVLNVALGGNLYQDINTQVAGSLMHEQGKIPGDCGIHKIKIVEGTLLHKIMGRSELMVNTYHHQAVKKPAHGLIVASTAADGIIEAIELTNAKYVLGVQWHPERMWRMSPENFNLFKEFVNACT